MAAPSDHLIGAPPRATLSGVTLLYSTPPTATLPLAKGEDVDVEFIYKEPLTDGSGDPILDPDGNLQFVDAPFPDGATVTLYVEPTASAAATIVGSVARATIDHTDVDRVPDCSLWRLVMTVAEVDRVLINGTVQRFDGR